MENIEKVRQSLQFHNLGNTLIIGRPGYGKTFFMKELFKILIKKYNHVFYIGEKGDWDNCESSRIIDYKEKDDLSACLDSLVDDVLFNQKMVYAKRFLFVDELSVIDNENLKKIALLSESGSLINLTLIISTQKFQFVNADDFRIELIADNIANKIFLGPLHASEIETISPKLSSELREQGLDLLKHGVVCIETKNELIMGEHNKNF